MTITRLMMMGAAGGINVSGTLWAWGINSNGSLGLGNTTSYSVPMQVGELNNWVSCSASNSASAAINEDGELFTWGFNGYGRLGLGDTTLRTSPTQVGVDTNWASVAVGYTSMTAIKTDGTMWSWGSSADGSLGLGNTAYYSSPVQVGALTDWATANRCSDVHSMLAAIKTDGTLWTCGYNLKGGLGLGDTTNRSSPTQVGALTNWVEATIGRNSMLARKTDGTIWNCGYNGPYGYLGLGDTTNRSSPTQIGVATNWTSTVQSRAVGHAINSSGELWAWGRGGLANIGDGTTSNRSVPVQIGALTDWVTVNKDAETGCAAAIKTDKTLWAWGINAVGRIGDGTSVNKSSPVQVGSDTDWDIVASGVNHTLAIKGSAA